MQKRAPGNPREPDHASANVAHAWATRARAVALIAAFVGASCTAVLSLAPAAQAAQPDVATQARASATYAKLPLRFEKNQGQSDARVKFLTRGAGSTLFLTGDEAVLEVQRLRAAKPAAKAIPGTDHHEPQTIETSVVRPKVYGANPQAETKSYAKYAIRNPRWLRP